MRKVTVLFFVLATVLIALTSCIYDEEKRDGLTVGNYLPRFHVTAEIPDASDWRYIYSPYELTTDSLMGKKSIIVFFNTSCPDCQKELPVVQQVYDKVKADRRYSLVCIARKQDELAILDYWKANNLTLPYVGTKDRFVYNLFANSIIPRIYITDIKGRILQIFTDKSLASFTEICKSL